MSTLKVVLLLIAGLTLIFGIGKIIGHLIKVDKFLGDSGNRPNDLTIAGQNRDSEEE